MFTFPFDDDDLEEESGLASILLNTLAIGEDEHGTAVLLQRDGQGLLIESDDDGALLLYPQRFHPC